MSIYFYAIIIYRLDKADRCLDDLWLAKKKRPPVQVGRDTKTGQFITVKVWESVKSLKLISALFYSIPFETICFK